MDASGSVKAFFYRLCFYILYEFFPNLVQDTPPVTDPCIPSPCGPYSQCSTLNNQASCSCVPRMIGSPPNCKPECIQNSECSIILACFNQKCKDPCLGSCGQEASCLVVNHVAHCNCPNDYTGNPFIRCTRVQKCKDTLKKRF